MDKDEIDKKKVRALGQHLTSIDIFKEYIFPKISSSLYDYIWVDLYCGEGNLILPILDYIPQEKRISFFEEHIFLFDVQKKMIEVSISNAMKYGIPEGIAKKNIIEKDTLKEFPEFLKKKKLPIFHITNPPYLYVGYIIKHRETQGHLRYFLENNRGYQDLYQIALMNDLRANILKMIYIIPSNFLFGSSVSNKIRKDFLENYKINSGVIFEKKIFDFTGTNVGIFFFERKQEPSKCTINFEGIKINKEKIKRNYSLSYENNYRAGDEFEEFIKKNKSKSPLKIKYYLMKDYLDKNQGENKLEVIDVNEYQNSNYNKKILYINKEVLDEIKSNILFIRTVDTGSDDGKVGLYQIREKFNVDGIFVSKAKYRTYPIQIFFEQKISLDDQILLKKYFNFVLEHLREKTDSEFMTTYKYSTSNYTRKYLGLSQVKKMIETFPIFQDNKDKEKFEKLINEKNILEVIKFLEE